MLEASVRVRVKADRKGVRVHLSKLIAEHKQFYDLSSPWLRTNLVSEPPSHKIIFEQDSPHVVRRRKTLELDSKNKLVQESTEIILNYPKYLLLRIKVLSFLLSSSRMKKSDAT